MTMDLTTANIELSRDEFARHLAASQLLSDGELDRLLAARPAADAISLGAALVADGVLTDFQLDALARGRTAGLRVGNYDVLDKLGAGGMGAVFKARHRRMKRVVALKVLSAAACQDAAFVQRFQREVETVARLAHPNVVTAFDADEDVIGHFLVMEFVNGRDLTAHVRKNHPLTVREAVDCVVQAAHGLAYAHAQGVVHRDIKPANLLRDAAGVVKVTDLGLARLNGPQDESTSATEITQAGGVLGTADYMAPEQAVDSTAIDGRADVYSLGATLHFLLTGAPPFTGKSGMAVLLKHREAPVPSLRAARPDVPADLDAVFQRMMAKAPADRPQTMDAVIAALNTVVAAGLPASAPAGAASAVLSSGSSISLNRPQSGTIFDGPGQGTDLSVLLVEPSKLQTGIIRRYLEGQDVAVTATAASGAEAVLAVRAVRPGAVLSAFHLPDMTAADLARKVREEYPRNAPGFVILSGDAERDGGESLSQLNRVVLLPKPFTPEQLVQTLNAVTGKSITVKSSASFVGRPKSSAGLPKPAVDRKTLSVLVVDDSSTARAYMKAVLTGLGFATFTDAADGAQAVAAAAQARFDLVVTDYNMPVMDGAALTSYLRQTPATAAIPILMVTTETDEAMIAAARQAGVTAIFGKKFPAAEVKPVVDKLFGA